MFADETLPGRWCEGARLNFAENLLREALHLVKEFKASLSHRYHLEYA